MVDSENLNPSKPWGRSRIELERMALVSCWDNERNARQILEFPDNAWVRESHRDCARVIRRILGKGMPIDPILVVHEINNAPGVHENVRSDVYALWEWYGDNVRHMAGIERTAIEAFRSEYQWECGARALLAANKGIRGGDYAEWYARLHKQVLSLAPGSDEGDSVRRFSEILEAEVRKANSSDPKDAIKPVSSGNSALDDAIGGGFYRGDNILIVGAPGHGKTTLAWEFATAMSMALAETYFLSLEMKAHKMAKRAMAKSANVNMKRLRNADRERAAKLSWVYKNIHFDDRFCTIDEYFSRVEAFVYRHPEVFAVFCDHSGTLQDHESNRSAHAEANRASAAWLRTAKQLYVCSFMLQQPNNEYKSTGIPNTRYIRNTGKFEEDADVIIWCHHPFAFDKAKPRDLIELHLLKNREGQRDIVIPLKWTAGQFTMQERATKPRIDPVVKFEELPEEIGGVI